MSWFQNLCNGIATLFGISPELKLQKYKDKKQFKKDRENIKNQYRDFFARLEVPELKLIEKLISNNNQPCPYSWKLNVHDDWYVDIDGVDEKNLSNRKTR